MQTAVLLTAEEFFHLPDSIEGGKMELACGKVVTMSPVGRPHSKTALRIANALTEAVEAEGAELHMELGFILSRKPDTVRAPDVAFISAAQLTSAGEWETFFVGPPALAVEVWSPEDRERDAQKKIREYLNAGTSRVWDVRPREQTVTVHRQDGSAIVRRVGDTLDSDDAGLTLPGFELSLTQLFA